jgi:malate dehydrogenase (oxaloacetate-decarboxylating)(NADP+)
VRASQINDAMKIAAAQALAALAREDVPDEVDAAYGGRRMRYGTGYLIPVPFDPRLITTVPLAVAQAAMDSGVARRPIADMDGYRRDLAARLDRRATTLHFIYERLRANPRRTVFAEGEEDRTIRAAQAYRGAGYGTPVLIGRDEEVAERMKALGIENAGGLEIHNAKLSTHNKKYTDFLYNRLRRRGFMYRDCQRMVNLDRNVFAACMVACGDADAMVTGATRSFAVAFEDVSRAIDPKPGERVIGLQIVITDERTVFISDMRVHERPSAEELADIAMESAAYARRLGHAPRVALLSYSNFGQPSSATTERIRDAVAILDRRGVDFEYDGEMAADTALNPELMARLYPFCRLTGPANVLVMPALHSASIAAKLMQEIGGGTVIGPILLGLEKPVQIVQMGATADDLVMAAALAAHDAIA